MSPKLIALVIVIVVVICIIFAFPPSNNADCIRSDQRVSEACDDDVQETTSTSNHLVEDDSSSSSSSMLEIPESVTYVIMEVGTSNKNNIHNNLTSILAPHCARDRNCFYVAVDFLSGERTTERICNPNIVGTVSSRVTKRGRHYYSSTVLNSNASDFKLRCIVITAAVAPRTGWATFRASAGVENDEFSDLTVPLMPLDELVDMVPRKLSVNVITLGDVGHQFEAASSLRRNQNRVANLIVKGIQDLPNHKINNNNNAGHLKACMTKKWGWVESGSAWTHGEARELNMIFSNPLVTSSSLVVNGVEVITDKIQLQNDDGKCPNEEIF